MEILGRKRTNDRDIKLGTIILFKSFIETEPSCTINGTVYGAQILFVVDVYFYTTNPFMELNWTRTLSLRFDGIGTRAALGAEQPLGRTACLSNVNVQQALFL